MTAPASSRKVLRILRILRVLAVGVLVAAGCSGGDGGGSTEEPAAGGGGELDGTITVLGASSLTDALAEVSAAFEDRHPGADVALSFDGTPGLVAAVLEGAPVDVLVLADAQSVDRLRAAELLARDPVIVATNRMVIAVPRGNPDGIADLADLREGGLRIALCRAEVPCGRYAREAFAAAGVAVPDAGREASVRAVLAKVQLGEADAGIVYATDVEAAADVDAVEIGAPKVTATYPAAVIDGSSNADGARAYLEFLSSAEARRILATFGFGQP